MSKYIVGTKVVSSLLPGLSGTVICTSDVDLISIELTRRLGIVGSAEQLEKYFKIQIDPSQKDWEDIWEDGS